MGCTVTRSRPVGNIASEEFSRNNSVADETDKERNETTNVAHQERNENYIPAPRVVADFSWLSNNKE